MLRGLRGPEAEAVVVLRGQDERAKACALRDTRPAARIERCRVEDRRRLGAVAPLAVGERVHPEMQEDRELVAVPLPLCGGGNRPVERATGTAAARQRARAQRQRTEQKRAAIQSGVSHSRYDTRYRALMRLLTLWTLIAITGACHARTPGVQRDLPPLIPLPASFSHTGSA